MVDSSIRKMDCIEKDMISELSCPLQETILGFLPIRDAVRSSALSRKWRHKWTMIPHLIFDDQFFDSKRKNLRQYQDKKLRAHGFVSVINKVLLLHQGPILEFSLTNLEGCDTKIVHDYISQWLPLLSRNGIKKFNLKNCHFDNIAAYGFSSLDLTQLRLDGVLFSTSPSFRSFTCLRSLELVDCINNKPSIFVCPVLGELVLIYCEGLLPNNFRAPNLKRLKQAICKLPLEYSLAGLPNLKEFSCTALTIPMINAKAFSGVNFLDSLHTIEKLSLKFTFVKAMEINDAVEGNLRNYLAKKFVDCTFEHLEIVTCTWLRGLRDELELVKFLLANSPLLKKMFIHHCVTVRTDVALNIAEEMLQYARASSEAQIRFLKDDLNIEYF
ncbi:F-box/FBD/LRR-repeat protein At1g13570 [Daucus carota subsp. sativus]|uniref:F-box/FBD/LRR-repeat protein At1g13570 n=1 Tax=Daucus carota subsp. sativus TaxID=79200 RepID=UPI0007EF2470|nr:PREDICTED: F-box/FBD/LRR-repeat protein At1g13570-like [Daucus carota subsp. sativus]